MEEKQPTCIKKIEIRGLFGRYDLDWELHPDVNILSGLNGSGKSTVVKKKES